MRLSRKSHDQLETFFRYYFQDENLRLPRIELFGRGFARLLAKVLSIYGITFGRFIFIRPALLSRNENDELCIPKELMAHEAAHALQYQRLGWLRFFYTYLKGYWQALRKKEKCDLNARMQAYLEIPHEVEARACAAAFIEWSSKMENGKRKTDN
jgi:hypothetical protein